MNSSILRNITAALLLIGFGLSAKSITLEEAKKLYRDGDYETSLPAFKAALAKRPRDGSLNHWVGVCLYHQGDFDEAAKHLKAADSRNVTEAPRYLALIAFNDYRFSEAENYIRRYEAAMAKAKKSVPDDFEAFAERVSRAKAMFDGVRA